MGWLVAVGAVALSVVPSVVLSVVLSGALSGCFFIEAGGGATSPHDKAGARTRLTGFAGTGLYIARPTSTFTFTGGGVLLPQLTPGSGFEPDSASVGRFYLAARYEHSVVSWLRYVRPMARLAVIFPDPEALSEIGVSGFLGVSLTTTGNLPGSEDDVGDFASLSLGPFFTHWRQNGLSATFVGIQLMGAFGMPIPLDHDDDI